MRWIKGPTNRTSDGGYFIEYRLEADDRLRVITSMYPVPHANGEGHWLAVKYIASWPHDAKEFHLLCNAKKFLELMYMEGRYDF